MPNFVKHDDFVKEIYNAKFKKLPSDFKALHKDELNEIRKDPKKIFQYFDMMIDKVVNEKTLKFELLSAYLEKIMSGNMTKPEEVFMNLKMNIKEKIWYRFLE